MERSTQFRYKDLLKIAKSAPRQWRTAHFPGVPISRSKPFPRNVSRLRQQAYLVDVPTYNEVLLDPSRSKVTAYANLH